MSVAAGLEVGMESNGLGIRAECLMRHPVLDLALFSRSKHAKCLRNGSERVETWNSLLGKVEGAAATETGSREKTLHADAIRSSIHRQPIGTA